MKGKKGLELPINMIVVIAIAVLVLVVVAAFFAGRLGSGTNDIALEGAFSQGCNTLRTIYNCAPDSPVEVRGYAPPGTAVVPGQTPVSNFFGSGNSICALKGLPESNICARACGCTI